MTSYVSVLFVLGLCVTVPMVSAQAQDRISGLPTDLALKGAEAALTACEVKGSSITAVVVDEAGHPIVMLSARGAGLVTQRLALSKAAIAAKLRMSSADAAERARTDSTISNQLILDPAMGYPLPGGIPILIGGQVVGAISVSGASGDLKDEDCTLVGLERMRSEMK